MKHRLLLILLTFISASVFGQTFGPWRDGANGIQYRWKYNSPTDSLREFRHLIKSPQKPFAITDSLNKLEAFVNKKDFLSTGLIDHAALSATIGGTTFNISAGHGVVANFDNHFYPSIKRVNITAKTGITPQFLTTAITSYVAIDSNDNVVQSASPFTDVQSRDLIILGAIVHSNLTNINAVNNIAKPVISNTNQIHDLYEAVGALNTAGNKYSANGANLNIDKSAGNLFKLGVNFINDWKSPSKLTIAPQTAATFRYRTQTGTEFADRTTIDPGFYDVAGTRTAIPGSLNQFTIQRITLFQSGLTRIQYGQNLYANKSEAMADISTESFTTETNIAENGIFRAYLVVRGNATTLNDLAQAEFIEVGKFGSPIGNAGGAVTSANIIAALGYTPENVANKQNTLTTDGTGVKYATVDAVNAGLSGYVKLNPTSPQSGTVKVDQVLIGTNATVGTENVALKADITNTGNVVTRSAQFYSTQQGTQSFTSIDVQSDAQNTGNIDHVATNQNYTKLNNIGSLDKAWGVYHVGDKLSGAGVVNNAYGFYHSGWGGTIGKKWSFYAAADYMFLSSSSGLAINTFAPQEIIDMENGNANGLGAKFNNAWAGNYNFSGSIASYGHYAMKTVNGGLAFLQLADGTTFLNSKAGKSTFLTAGLVNAARITPNSKVQIGNTVDDSTPDTGESLQVLGDIKATSYTGGATLTGTPTSTTPTAGDNSTRIATTAYVQNMLSSGSGTFSASVVSGVTSTGSATQFWTKIGDIIHVSGSISITPTTAGTQADIVIDLPIASNLASGSDLGGSAGGTNFNGGSCFADVTGDKVQLRGIPTTSGVANVVGFSYSYKILP